MDIDVMVTTPAIVPMPVAGFVPDNFFTFSAMKEQAHTSSIPVDNLHQPNSQQSHQQQL